MSLKRKKGKKNEKKEEATDEGNNFINPSNGRETNFHSCRYGWYKSRGERRRRRRDGVSSHRGHKSRRNEIQESLAARANKDDSRLPTLKAG